LGEAGQVWDAALGVGGGNPPDAYHCGETKQDQEGEAIGAHRGNKKDKYKASVRPDLSLGSGIRF
jgi:hypothetical protein